MSNHTTKSLRASVISTLARLRAEMDDSPENLEEYKGQAAEFIDEVIEKFKPDPTGWSFFKGKMFYDIYLLQRNEEGTTTSRDLTRPGLKSIDFADQQEFYKHCVRVGETRQRYEYGESKVCAACGEEKPANKFKFRGGAKCNACRSKEYRERKNAS